jgi:hypothetical protein
MRTLATKARAINQYNGLGNQLWDLAGNRPSLDLPFADNKSLVDATTGANLVDFTRASSGTYVDSEGVIRTATTNLLLRSEEFETTWTTARASVSSDLIASPSGTTTADKLVEDTTQTSTHLAQQSVSVTTGTAYTFSLFAKAGERNFVQLVLQGQFATVTSAIFDLSTGVVGATTGTPSTSAVLLSDGWWRLSITATANATGSTSAQVRVSNSSATATYTGDGTSGIYLWGAQLEQSTTVGEYIPTTSTINSAPRFDHNPTTGESLGLLVEESRQNLLEYSEDISQWSSITGGSPTITPNADTAPDGTNTATLIENTGTTGYIGDATAYTSGTTYTFSGYFKANDGDKVAILLYSSGATSGFWNSETFNVATTFDLTNGTFTAFAGAVAPTTSTITDAGNGWWRCSITATATSNSSGANQLIRNMSGGTEGIYVWGYQIEAGSFPTSYIPTTGATATRAADVASISGSNFGVSRTNLLLRSEEFDTASWTKINSSIGTNVVTAPNGSLTADKLIENTANTTHLVYAGSLALTAGQPYVVSVYLKAAERTFASIGSVTSGLGTGIDLSTGVLVDVKVAGWTNAATRSVANIGNGWYRVTVVIPSATGNNSLFDSIRIFTSNGTTTFYTGDGTSGIYIWGAQLETGSTATAYIPTTTAAVTVVESPWYRQDEGTVFTEFNRPAAVTGLRSIAAVSDGGYNNRMTLRTDSAVFMNSFVTTGGVNQATFPLAINSGANNKAALAYATNDFNAGVNGVSGTNDTVGTVPVVDRLSIGSVLNAEPSCSYVRRLTYWPARLPNETLQTITQ